MQVYGPAGDDAGMTAVQLDGLDAFGAPRGVFDALVAALASVPASLASGWTHDQLEEHLETGGRELLRQLFQDHLDLRALRERHAVQVQQAAAQGRVVAITDAEGISHARSSTATSATSATWPRCSAPCG